MVSVCPVKAPEGTARAFTHSSFGHLFNEQRSFISFGLVFVMSLKCLLNVPCKHQCRPDLSIGVTSCYAFGLIFKTYCCIHLTFFSKKMHCQVAIVKWTLHLTADTSLSKCSSLIPEVTCLHSTILKAKLDILKYVRKSFPELQLT